MILVDCVKTLYVLGEVLGEALGEMLSLIIPKVLPTAAGAILT